MEKTTENKRKKRVLIIAALIAVPGFLIAGVFASNTSITLNNNVPLSLGAGYTTATTCDSAVNVSASQSYSDTSFKVTAISISNINQTAEHCGGKTLTLVAVLNDGVTSTTLNQQWTIPAATEDANIFQYDHLADGGTNDNILYSPNHLVEFPLDQLSTIAVGIA